MDHTTSLLNKKKIRCGLGRDLHNESGQGGIVRYIKLKVRQDYKIQKQKMRVTHHGNGYTICSHEEHIGI